MSTEDSSDEDIPGLESVSSSSSEYVEDSDSDVLDSSSEDDTAPVLPSSVDPNSPNYITAKRWLEQDRDSINRHLDIIAVYMFSPFLYGHAHQTDKWLSWCQEVGLLLSDIDFNTGELSESERNAVDVLDKAMEYCRDSMKEDLPPDCLSMLLQVSEKVNLVSTIKEAVRAARKRKWFMVMLQAFDGGGVTNESIGKMNFVEIGCLYAINQTAEHVLKYVKERYSYVKEFEEDCAADDKQYYGLKKKADDLYRARRYREAVDECSSAILCCPYNHWMYTNRALCYLELKQYRAALSDGIRAIYLKPDFVQGYVCYIQGLHACKETTRAREAYKSYLLRFSNPRERELLWRAVPSLSDKERIEPTEEDKILKEKVMGRCKQASEAYLQDSNEQALYCYDEAIRIAEQNKGWQHCMGYSECDRFLVSLYYAYGCALLKKGSCESAESALNQFEMIISEYQSSMTFPPAHYGSARAYIQLHRHSEALSVLRRGLDIVTFYRPSVNMTWPGVDELMQDCLPQKIELKLQQLQQQCEPVSLPDATCRYRHCLQYHASTSIIVEDPDYKGHVMMQCSKSCSIAYHSKCWRKFKGDNFYKTDRDLLLTPCLTPDCGGGIKTISVYDNKGIKLRFDAPPGSFEKQERAIQLPMSPSSKDVQTAKGSVVKTNKLHKMSEKPPSKKEKEKVEEENGERQLERTRSSNVMTPTLDHFSQPPKPAATISDGKGTEMIEDTRKVEDSLVVINRRAECKEQKDSEAIKLKVKRKKNKGKKHLMMYTHPERKGLMAEAGKRQLKPSASLQSTDLMPRPLIAMTTSGGRTWKDVVTPSTPPTTYSEDFESVCSYFAEIFREHGPLHSKHAYLKDAFDLLPEDKKQLIRRAGGLIKFLLNFQTFKFHGDVISLRSGGQRPVIPPKTLDTTTHSKPVQNEAAIQLPSDIPMVHMLAQNRGEHQPKLKLDKNTMRMCPNPLSPPKSRRNFYPMNSQKHGVALIINNKKLSEGSTYKMADCDELNLTETLKFLGYDVVIKHTCSHDVVVNLFEQIEIQCLDPVKISDSFVCCILSCGDERMLYGADNKPVELKKIQETVSNCQVLKNLPKLFFIQAYMGKQLDPAGHFVLSQCSDFYFSCAVTSSELPFRDPNRGSSYITELCKALCTHSTDMVLSDILKNVGTILKAKHDSNCQLLKEDSQLTKDVYFFHGADESSLNSVGHHLSGKELLALQDILQEHVIDSLKNIGFDVKTIGDTQATIEEAQSLLYSLEQHEIASSLRQCLDLALEKQSHYEAYEQALKEGVAISLKYLKVLFFGPPRTGKTSMRRRLIGEIQNLSNEPFQASTGTTEMYDVIVKLVEDKTTTSTTVITKSKWSTVKALHGKEKCSHETDLDEELWILYQIINGVVLTIQKISHVSDAFDEKETQDEATSHVPIPVNDKKAQDEATKVKGPTNVKMDSVPSANPPKAVKINPNAFIQEVASDGKPMFRLSAKEMEEIEKAFVAFKKVLHTPGQEELKVLLDGTMLLNMVDTGGQPAFLEMLPALTIGPALYLIFFRLNQNLKQRYKIQYVSEDNEAIEFEDSSYTVEEVIFQALSSIACFSCTAHKKANVPSASHAAMLIATHKDQLGSDPEAEIKAKDAELKENLKEVLETDPFKNFLHFFSDDQFMFAIDNMKGDEQELTEVRQRLEDVIKQEFDDFPIPASWLMFNIFLRKMGNRILSLLQCREIGRRLEVTNTDEALWFLHHCVGTLMHFPDIEEIKDIVICDPQVVFDSVTDLILNSFKLKRVNKIACDKFKESGQFSFKDIQKIARNSKSNNLTLPQLVKLLEHFNIIVPVEPEGPSSPSFSASGSLCLNPRISPQLDADQAEKLVYFMPAVLKNAQEEELHMEQSSTDPIPLIIHFKCGFIPIGVFCAKVASLVAQRDTLGWILQEPSKHQSGHILRKNKATFRINGLYDVTLISMPKWYEIHIACISTTHRAAVVRLCCHVVETICDTLDQVISKMRYKHYLTSSSSCQTLYELGFKCPKHPNDDHLVINKPKSGVEPPPQSAKTLWLNYFEGKSTMICPLEGGKAIDFTETSLPHLFAEQSLVWFGNVTKTYPVLPDSILDDPQLPKIVMSHLQLIRYCPHASNKQAVRLLQCLAPKWRKVGEILGLHRAVIQTIENPGSGRDPEDCIRQVFVKWLDNASQLPNYHQYPFTWRGLHNLLIDSDNGEAAVELKVALSSQFNSVQGTCEAASKTEEFSNQAHSTVAKGVSHLKLFDTLQTTETRLPNATQSQDQTSEPHSTTITVKDATPGTLPMVELKAPQLQEQAIQHHSLATTAGEHNTPEKKLFQEKDREIQEPSETLPIVMRERKGTATDIAVPESQITESVEQNDQLYTTSSAESEQLQQPSETVPVVAIKPNVEGTHLEFHQSMSFEEFMKFLKQKGVMRNDIDLLTRESINAEVFVILEEKDFKKLGLSFGGRKILKKLLKELPKQNVEGTHLEFHLSMSFEEFMKFLKQKGVMKNDIDLLTRESVNAQVLVIMEEEECKELGLSFGGVKILTKLLEELK